MNITDIERLSMGARLHEMLSSPIAGSDVFPTDPTNISPDKLLTEEEAAAEGKVSESTIRRLIKEERIEFVDLGRNGRHNYRIPFRALATIKPQASKPAPPPRQRRTSKRISGNVADYLPRVD